MKQLKLYLALAMIALVAFGCSKDKPTEPPPTTTTTTVTQQTSAASAGEDMASTCESGVGDFSGYLSGFKKASGKTVYDSTYWWGPDATGWYYLYWNAIGGIVHPDSAGSDTTNYAWLWKINFYHKPDAPDSVEWYWTYSDTFAAYFSYHGKVMYDHDGLHIKGFWTWGVYTPASYDFSWSFTFDSISTATNDYQGHYNFTCNNWPCYTGSGYELVALTGDYRFNVDGSGAGSLSLNSTEVVRYVFYAMSAATRGYYTLAAESWATQHSFGSKK
ncbi:hypothetical protein HY768_11545 [candidate division TA06 bacterium]|uniref:Lipoprotein n=1 Tax=candidate division TA06 bacterium TaxID=2250710 RepID=A0A933ICL4_UNCT6|nr:hypothetical protein [candidate division TA06 bacterium]